MKKGFTLIEVLVVITIIILITLVVIFNVAATRAKSRDALRITDVKQIQQALQTYFSSCYTYPDTLSDLITTSVCGGNAILNSLPKDPETKADYTYFKSTTPLNFHICTTLESYPTSGRAGVASFGGGDVCDGTVSGAFDLVGGTGV